MTGIHAMDASLSLFEEAAWTFVEERLAENVRLLEDRLESISGCGNRDASGSGQSVAGSDFSPSRASCHRRACTTDETGVICSPRAGIRLSPHFYTPNRSLRSTMDKIP